MKTSQNKNIAVKKSETRNVQTVRNAVAAIATVRNAVAAIATLLSDDPSYDGFTMRPFDEISSIRMRCDVKQLTLLRKRIREFGLDMGVPPKRKSRKRSSRKAEKPTVIRKISVEDLPE